MNGYYDELRREFTDPARKVGWRHRIEQLYRFEVALDAVQDAENVLDVGCGLGDFAAFLRARKLSASYQGVDRDEEALRLAGERHAQLADVGFSSLDLTREPLPHADAVVAIGALVAGDAPDEGARVARINRLVKSTWEAARKSACIIVLRQEVVASRAILRADPSLVGARQDELLAAARRVGARFVFSDAIRSEWTLFLYREDAPLVLRDATERLEAMLATPEAAAFSCARRAWMALEVGLSEEARAWLERAPESDPLAQIVRERLGDDTG